MIATDNPATITFLATLTVVFGLGANLLGEVFVRLVDQGGEIVTADLLGYAAEVDGQVGIFRLDATGGFTDEMGRADDTLLALETPAVQERVAELAYYAADDIRARRAYLAA